jgi:hypothetical protein
MQEGKIVDDFLFPTDQEAPCAIGPGVGSFDDPPSSFGSPALGGRRGLALLRNVGDVSSSLRLLADRFGVVPFVGAEMLSLAWLRSGTPHGNAGERDFDQFLVMHIGAVDGSAHGHATSIGQHRPLDAQLAPIGRIFPCFFPHPAATWSSPRPDSAIANRSRPTRRTLSGQLATAPRTRRFYSIPENSRESRSLNRTHAAWPSTGSPFEAHRECQQRLYATAAAADLLRDSQDTWATAARLAAITPREHQRTTTRKSLTSSTSVQAEKRNPYSAVRTMHGLSSVFG